MGNALLIIAAIIAAGRDFANTKCHGYVATSINYVMGFAWLRWRTTS